MQLIQNAFCIALLNVQLHTELALEKGLPQQNKDVMKFITKQFTVLTSTEGLAESMIAGKLPNLRELNLHTFAYCAQQYISVRD